MCPRRIVLLSFPFSLSHILFKTSDSMRKSRQAFMHASGAVVLSEHRAQSILSHSAD